MKIYLVSVLRPNGSVETSYTVQVPDGYSMEVRPVTLTEGGAGTWIPSTGHYAGLDREEPTT